MESTSRENITFKNPFKTDIAVLLLFFTRSDTFRQVFEAVRQARPSKLLLYQDGPRGERDMAGIEAFYDNPEELIGKRILFVANFAPRTMMGIESQGMILSAVDSDESLSVVTTTKDVKPGSQVG